MTARTRRKANTTPEWFSTWTTLSTPVRHGICLALLAVIAMGFMAPDLFSNRELVGGDIVQWKAMAQSLFDWKEATGEIPMWATGPFMGMPAVEVSYPLSVPQIDDLARLLRGLMWPTSHLLILFGGMYGLVYHLTRDHWAGTLAAVAFGLTTYLPILLVAGHHSKYVALALAPWLLWAFVYARRSPGLLPALLFAVATAASLRAGHVQITYYAAFTIGVWWVVDAVRAFRGGTVSSFAASTLWLVVGGILGILMVADPYLTKAAYKEFTIRGTASGGGDGGIGWDYAMGWSQGWGELLTLFIADASGGSGSTYWGPKIFTGGPHYVGGIVLMLAGFVIGFARRPAVWGLSIAALLMVALSLGENLEILSRFMFEYFPLFDAFRVPETWLSMVALVLAVLAGFGLREVVRRSPDPQEDASLSMKLRRYCSAAVGIAALFTLFGTTVLDFQKPNELELLARQVAAQRPDVSLQDPQTQQFLIETIDRVTEERRDKFNTDARRTFLFLLLASGVLVAARRRKIPAFTAQAALVLLVALDLGGMGRRYFNSDALVPSRQTDNLVQEYGFDTFLTAKAEAEGGDGHFRVLSLEGDPNTSARPAFFHESLGGYHGAKLRRYQDFLDNLLFDRSTGLPSRTALAISNTRYVVSPGIIPGMDPVFSDQATGFTVFEVPDVLDRAFLVDSLVVISEPSAQWRAIQAPAFDPSRAAVVGADIGLAAVPDSVSGRVSLLQYTPDDMSWSVATSAPRLLVISEVYYPGGWTATVDGAAAEIIPANYFLRGVAVPEGAHEVRLTFSPTGRRAGLWISWGSTGLVYGLLGFLLFGLWKRRRGD
ncbi:MAG: hypothetical protein ACI9W4_002000 [Rhodothermales bacterium]